jgi:Amt family ammonium transporter
MLNLQHAGYSLVYGPSQGGVIGNADHFLLLGVDYNRCTIHAPKIPAAAFALFQMMFAAITPLLMTGAFAERVKWRAFIMITVLWEVFVYYPVAHWIVRGTFLHNQKKKKKLLPTATTTKCISLPPWVTVGRWLVG